MLDWWSDIPAFQKAFWYFAIPFTTLFIIQTILTFLGLGESGGLDFDDGSVGDNIDFDGDDGFQFESGSSFPIFTVRNFIVFFTVFGWTGITATTSGFGNIITIILAVLLGLTVMFIVAGIFYFMSKMTESGNLKIINAIGKMGEVYLFIPEKRTGVGKVHIKVQGAVREIDAVTDGERISTGATIVVTEIVDNRMLLVEEIEDKDFF